MTRCGRCGGLLGRAFELADAIVVPVELRLDRLQRFGMRPYGVREQAELPLQRIEATDDHCAPWDTGQVLLLDLLRAACIASPDGAEHALEHRLRKTPGTRALQRIRADA